jgi:sugar lactone lactonase YvrE
VKVNLAGKAIKLHAPDGKAIPTASVLVGGKLLSLGADGLALPSALASQARQKGRLVLVPGYLPARVTPDTGDLALVPAQAMASAALPGGGGTLAGGAIQVAVPPGVLLGTQTRATLQTYQPDPAAGDAGLADVRAAMATAAGHPGVSTCDQPLPCPPTREALGLFLQLEGPVASGSLSFAIDLAALQADPARAAAAKRILDTFAAMDATNDPTWRQALKQKYDLRLEGHTLYTMLQLGGAPERDGYLQVDVAGSSLLGVRLEVTVLSEVQTGQPGVPGNAPAGSVGVAPALGGAHPDPDDLPAASLISPNGGTLVTDNGSGIIANNGGGLIANNGGALVGEVRVPFQPELAKFGLLTYADYPWPQVADVRAVDLDDAALTAWFTDDAQSRYRVEGLPATPRVVFVGVNANVYKLRAMAPAPGEGGTSTVDVNAATTAVASLAAEEVRNNGGSVEDIDLAGYPADVAQAKQLLDQADAQALVANSRSAAASLTAARFNAGGYDPRSIPWAAVTTIAGAQGVASLANGPGAGARFNNPTGVDVAPNGDLIVADRDNNRIVRIEATPPYTVTTLAGSGSAGLADGSGALARFNVPRGVKRRGTKLYVADGDNQAIRVVDLADPSHPVTTLAGGNGIGLVDGPGGTARFHRPVDVAADSQGNVYVADYENNAVRKVTSAGVVSTLAGDGTAGYVDGPGATARFRTPFGLCVDAADNVYVSDTGNHRIRQISPAGRVSTLLGDGPGFENGPIADARVNTPSGVCLDAAGNLYITEVYNNRVRKVDFGREVVTTVAGTSTRGFADGKGLRARFYAPRGIAALPGGGLVVVDRDNMVVRLLK